MNKHLITLKQRWLYLATQFLIFGFVGWIFETLVVLVTKDMLTNRGFLFITEVGFLNRPLIWGLPFIDMYAYGGLLIILFFKPIKNKPWLVFLLGMIVMTLFELIGGIWCRHVLKHDYWTYYKEFLNYEGYICLQSTIAWGVLSVVCIYVFEPVINRIETTLNHYPYFKQSVILLLVYIVFLTLLKYFIAPGITPY